LAGAGAAIVPNWIIDRLKERRTVKAFTDSIVCEVSAILTIIGHRRYFETIEQIEEHLRSTPGSTRKFSVVVPDNYFKIYHANLDRVNLIDSNIRVKVVTFYQLLEAIIQDVKPGGMLSSEAWGVEPFTEALSILKQAMELGHEIERIWIPKQRVAEGRSQSPGYQGLADPNVRPVKDNER
jgi:hypothetical protein